MSIQSKRQREIKSIEVINKLFKSTEGTKGRCELDLHADTCVAGANFVAWEFSGLTCEVSPFTDEYESMKDVPVVTAATAWTNEETGETLFYYFIRFYGMATSCRTVYSIRIKNSTLWSFVMR
jgi:hypothetical protein